MSEIDDYALEELYASDPDSVTAAVITEAAAAAAAEVAIMHDQRRDEEMSRVRAGQEDSARIAARDALEQQYGKEQFESLLPKISQKIQQNPHLVPDEILVSPTALAHAVSDVVKIVRVEAEAEADADLWNQIKGQSKNMYPSRGPLG